MIPVECLAAALHIVLTQRLSNTTRRFQKRGAVKLYRYSKHTLVGTMKIQIKYKLSSSP